MKNSINFVILVSLLGLLPKTKCALPNQIRVAAIFEQNGDRKHELAFKYGVERVNMEYNILRGKRLEPEIIKIPVGNRYDYS